MLRGDRRATRGNAGRWQRRPPRQLGPVCRLFRRQRGAPFYLAEEQQPAHRHSGRLPRCGRQERPRWRRRSDDRIGDYHDHRLRGFSRRRRCPGQGSGLSQLARPDEGRPDRDGDQGPPQLHPSPEQRPNLHSTRRITDHPARPLADAGAQCRRADDQPGDPAGHRGGDPGGNPRRRLHLADRAA